MSGMKPLSLAKHIRIIQWSVIILVLALAGLVAARLLAKGFSEIYSVNPSQILNISIQLFAIINPFSALPTFLAFTESLDEASRRKVANTTTLMVLALVFSFALFGQLILNALQLTCLVEPCERSRWI